MNAPEREHGLSIALLHNPIAGSYCANRVEALALALEAEGHSVQGFSSQSFPCPDSSAADVVCIFGGDGTARLVIEAGLKAQVDPLYCSFPAGTINLIAREADYPADIARFVKRIGAAPQPRLHHSGRLGDHAILCCASVGPDSHVVARVSPGLKKRIGRLAYGVAFLRLLVDWPRMEMDVQVDGTRHVAEAAFLLKGRAYAGPWSLDQEADLRSANFRLLLMSRARRRDMVRLALFAIFGHRFADPSWVRLSGQSIKIDAVQSIPVQVDGDIVAHTPVTIGIAPQRLRFL